MTRYGLDYFNSSDIDDDDSNCSYYEMSTEKHMVPPTFLESTILPVVCCSGIIGIILTVIVLSRKTMCTSTNCYLVALAIADLLFLLILSVQILLGKVNRTDGYTIDSSVYIIFNHYSSIFMNASHLTSVWVTVMLAVERYIAICHPLRAMAICNMSRARTVIVVLAILAFLTRIPNFFDFKFFTVTVKGRQIITINWISDAYDTGLYSWIVDGILTAILPFSILLVLNLRLILEIRKSSRYLRYHLAVGCSLQSVISTEQMKITLMLLAIIVAFFLCQGPYVVYNAMMAYNYIICFDSSINTYWFIVFKLVGKILLALKSSCNFVLYCWLSEKFWSTFKRIFCLRYCLPTKQMPKRNGTISQNNTHRPSYLITRETTC
ncbi:sex peptide receptor-like [Gigantopelta aegis]|uniref:sex peptide receptor-like n=1 Tax=Gigantopelta aegis TaxID=1735272 RepID=UPI001B88AB91|nr:sex peptide receptor-like [Gigantopelta aegis]